MRNADKSGWILSGLLSLVLAPAALADTWIVDSAGGPGVDFTDIQPAIEAASDGDVIVVATGNYTRFLLDKPLRIVVETGGNASLQKDFAIIRDIPAGTTAAVGGLQMQWMQVRDCAGTVSIDRCTIRDAEDHAALRIDDSSLVIVSRTLAWGRDRGVDGGPGSDPGGWQRGAEFDTATVVVSQSSFEGGAGSPVYKAGGTDGMAGVYAENCTLLFQTSDALGGRGGDGWDPVEFEGDGGDGGPGLWLQDSELLLFDNFQNKVRGDWGGVPGFLGNPGAHANALLAHDSTVSYSDITFQTEPSTPKIGGSGSTITLVSPSVPTLFATMSGELGDFIGPVLTAPVGSQFLLWYGGLADPTPVPGAVVPLVIAGPFDLVSGTIGPSGTAFLPLSIPAVLSLRGVPVHFQAYVRPPSGGFQLSTSASFVLH